MELPHNTNNAPGVLGYHSELILSQSACTRPTQGKGNCSVALAKGEPLPKKMESDRLLSLRTQERIFADRED
jgi:hypothetical protein